MALWLSYISMSWDPVPLGPHLEMTQTHVQKRDAWGRNILNATGHLRMSTRAHFGMKRRLHQDRIRRVRFAHPTYPQLIESISLYNGSRLSGGWVAVLFVRGALGMPLM